MHSAYVPNTKAALCLREIKLMMQQVLTYDPSEITDEQLIMPALFSTDNVAADNIIHQTLLLTVPPSVYSSIYNMDASGCKRLSSGIRETDLLCARHSMLLSATLPFVAELPTITNCNISAKYHVLDCSKYLRGTIDVYSKRYGIVKVPELKVAMTIPQNCRAVVYLHLSCIEQIFNLLVATDVSHIFATLCMFDSDVVDIKATADFVEELIEKSHNAYGHSYFIYAIGVDRRKNGGVIYTMWLRHRRDIAELPRSEERPYLTYSIRGNVITKW